jgi:hypothetical protein
MNDVNPGSERVRSLESVEQKRMDGDGNEKEGGKVRVAMEPMVH